MFDLCRHRVVLLNIKVLSDELLCPAVMIVVDIVVEVHVRETERTLRTEEAQTVLARTPLKEMILFSSQVIVPRAWRTIRDEVGCRNTIIEFDHDRSRILDLITANRVTRSSINARDLHASGVVQIVDIVDRVDRGTDRHPFSCAIPHPNSYKVSQ